jgi:hypothetical protein
MTASGGSGSLGIMRMASAIDVQWVAELIPMLKDPVDVQRLSQSEAQRKEKELSKHRPEKEPLE